MSTASTPAADRPVGVRRWIPGLQAVSDYQARWLTRDLIAGLVLTTLLVPVDTTASDMLEDPDVELNARNISLVFAEMKTPVREKIDRYKLTRTIDPAHFFPTLDDAVAAYLAVADQDWPGPRPHPVTPGG